MRDHTKLQENQTVLNGLIRACPGKFRFSTFSFQPNHQSSYQFHLRNNSGKSLLATRIARVARPKEGSPANSFYVPGAHAFPLFLNRCHQFTFFLLAVCIFLLVPKEKVSCQTIRFSRSNSGLIDNYVKSISSSKGVPVIATENGISIIHPDRFENWRRGEFQFPDASVNALANFHGMLWAGTAGKGIARLENNRWESFSVQNSGLIDDFVTALFGTSKRLFVGTRAGLCTFDGFLWETIHFDSIEAIQVNCIAGDDAAIYVGTNQGVFLIEKSLKPVLIPVGVNAPVSIQAIEAAGGNIFCGYDGGVIALLRNGQNVNWTSDRFSFARISGIVAIENGAMVSSSRGVWRINLDGGIAPIELGVSGVSSFETTALLHFAGFWWVGLSGGGVVRISENIILKPTTYSPIIQTPLPQKPVFEISNSLEPRQPKIISSPQEIVSASSHLEGRFQLPSEIICTKEFEGNLWLGCFDGLYSLKVGGGPQLVASRISCTNIAEVSNFLWVIFEDGKIGKLENGQLDLVHLSGVPPSPLCLGVDQGQIWIGSDRGLFVWKAIDQKPVVFSKFQNVKISSIQVTEDRIWLGTEQGLWWLSERTNKVDRLLEVSKPVSALLQRKSELWVAEKDELISLIKNERVVQQWETPNGARILQLISGEDNSIVAVTLNGVYQILPTSKSIREISPRGARAGALWQARLWVARDNLLEHLQIKAFTEENKNDVVREIDQPKSIENLGSEEKFAEFKTPGNSEFVKSPSEFIPRLTNVRVFSPPKPAGEIVFSPQKAETRVEIQTPFFPKNQQPPEWTQELPQSKPANLSFYKDIFPVIAKRCIPCHTTGRGSRFPLHDPAVLIPYFLKGGFDRFSRFISEGYGMFGVVSTSDAELIKIWVMEGGKE